MYAVKENVALEVKKNVLADYVDHNIVLSFLYDIGFVEKNSYNGIVILEREDEEEFSLIAVMCDEKNKNYRAQLINTLYTVADILNVNFDYLLSNILASYRNEIIEIKGFIEKVIDRKKSNDGFVVLKTGNDKDNSYVKLWLPEEEYEKARTCYSCEGYFVARMGNGSLFTLTYLNFVPDNTFIKTSFKVTCA